MFAKHDRASACTGLESRLEDYLEGQLNSSEAMEVETHLRSCARCAAALDRAKVSANLLSAIRARPLPEASPFFAGRVMAAIRHEENDQELWKPLEIAGWELCWLAAVAALVLALVMFRVPVAGPQLPVNASAQQIQVQELVNVPMSQPIVQDDSLLVASANDNGR
jgi:anti-sigma factor RsiW